MKYIRKLSPDEYLKLTDEEQDEYEEWIEKNYGDN
jgi:hypothetical protein